MSLADRVAQIRAGRTTPKLLSTHDYSTQMGIDGLGDRFNSNSASSNPETLRFAEIVVETPSNIAQRRQLLRDVRVEAILLEVRNNYWGFGQLIQFPHGYSLELSYAVRGKRTDTPTREFTGYETRLVEDNRTFGVGEHKRTIYHEAQVPVFQTTGFSTSFEQRQVRHALLVGILAPAEIESYKIASQKKDSQKGTVGNDLNLVLFIDPDSTSSRQDRLGHFLKDKDGYYYTGGSLGEGPGSLWLNEASRQIFSPKERNAQFVDAIAKYVVANDFDRIPLRYQIKRPRAD